MTFQTQGLKYLATGDDALDQAVTTVEPLITGSAPILWGGFAIFAAVFFITLMLIMRGRLAKPRQTENPEPDQHAFQAAEDTYEDINRDDPPAHDLTDDKSARHDEGLVFDQDPPDDHDAEKTERPKRMPFVNLFFSKKARSQNVIHEGDLKESPVELADLPDTDGRTDVSHDFKSEFNIKAAEAARHQAESEIAEMKRRAADEAEALWRRTEEDAARSLHAAEEEFARARQHTAETERARARAEAEIQAEAIRLAAEIRNETDREADFEQRKLTAAFERCSQSISAIEQTIASQTNAQRKESDDLRSDLAAQFEDRFTAFTRFIEEQIKATPTPDIYEQQNHHHASIEQQVLSYSESVSHQLAAHRDTMIAAMVHLADKINSLATAPEDVNRLARELSALRTSLDTKFHVPVSPLVQLSDIVRNTLAPSTFELRALMSNNRKADCLIHLAEPLKSIAVDARFPVEAFRQLSENDDNETGRGRAENTFRRTALNHIVDIVEHLIVPGQTVDSAVMFLPSETMLSTLHSRFPDIVQDSYRARVWIVSPTSFMATLHTISAVLQDAQRQAEAASHVPIKSGPSPLNTGQSHPEVTTHEPQFNDADEPCFEPSSPDYPAQSVNRDPVSTPDEKAPEVTPHPVASHVGEGLYSQPPADHEDDQQTEEEEPKHPTTAPRPQRPPFPLQ